MGAITTTSKDCPIISGQNESWRSRSTEPMEPIEPSSHGQWQSRRFAVTLFCLAILGNSAYFLEPAVFDSLVRGLVWVAGLYMGARSVMSVKGGEK